MYVHDIKRGIGEVQRVYITDFVLDIRQPALRGYSACGVENGRFGIDTYDMALWSECGKVRSDGPWTATDVKDT